MCRNAEEEKNLGQVLTHYLTRIKRAPNCKCVNGTVCNVPDLIIVRYGFKPRQSFTKK